MTVCPPWATGECVYVKSTFVENRSRCYNGPLALAVAVVATSGVPSVLDHVGFNWAGLTEFFNENFVGNKKSIILLKSL